MRLVVFGAGAVGGVVGGRLFEHGHDVVLIARGAHHRAIASGGLVLEAPERTVTLRIPVAADASEVKFGPDDVVLLAVKTQDTQSAVQRLARAAPASTPVVCLQNGVENERLALRSFANVYSVCVMCPTSHLAPGVVQAHSSPVTGILDLGRYPAGVDETAIGVARNLEASTFVSEPRSDIARWKYAKLLANLANAVEAVCGPSARSGPVWARAKEEGVACLRAAGIDFASDAEDAERRGDLLNLRPINGHARGGGSSWQSLSRGTGSIETDFITGEIVLLGRLFGIPTPVNIALQGYANMLACNRTAPGSVTAQAVMRAAREISI